MYFGNLAQFLMPCIVIAVVLVVIFTEMIKNLVKKLQLKDFKVYVPAALSLILSLVLGFGDFYPIKQVPFYWAVIFGISVFGYEAILKKINYAGTDASVS